MRCVLRSDDAYSTWLIVDQYGGGAAVAYDSVIIFSNIKDNRVYTVKEGDIPEAVVPGAVFRNHVPRTPILRTSSREPKPPVRMLRSSSDADAPPSRRG